MRLRRDNNASRSVFGQISSEELSFWIVLISLAEIRESTAQGSEDSLQSSASDASEQKEEEQKPKEEPVKAEEKEFDHLKTIIPQASSPGFR